VTVAKHGNRAMSSRCGSADVLEAFGVKIDAPPEVAAAALDGCGIAFLFAQAYHPAMRHVAPVRREIGVRTLFNIIGPLSNPAGAHRQIVGVPRVDLLLLVATALARLGCERAAVVHGHGGLDELSLAGENQVAEWTGETVIEYEIDPSALGLERRSNAELAGGDASHNARLVRRVLDGERGPHRDVVALNAALALVVAGEAGDLSAGMRLAHDVIDDGRARSKLEALVKATNG